MSHQAAELRFYKTPDEVKGVILSHLIGAAIFAEFVFTFISVEIPFTPLLSIPIRLIGLWLLIDRTGRVGRLRFSTWDWLMFGFVASVGIGLMFTSLTSPEIPVSFEDYRRLVGVILGMYLYYLVTREGLNRKGFRPDLLVRWILAAFFVSAMFGVAQHFDVPGVRDLTLRLYKSVGEGEVGLVGQMIDLSLAWGTSVGWNMMAFEMLVAFAIVFGPSFYRKPKWWEVALGGLFMAAFVCTESRGGLLAFGACGIAAVIFHLVNRKPSRAILIASILGAGVVIWLFLVFALKIERFTITLKGEKVRSSSELQSIDTRLERQQRTIAIGSSRPMFGTGPNSMLFPGDHVRVYYYSNNSIMGTIDGMYGLAFAQFGLVGVCFLLLIIGCMLRFISPDLARRPFAMTVFLMGVAFATHGMVEFLLYSRFWIVAHTFMALASSPFLVSEKGRILRTRFVPMTGIATATDEMQKV